MNPSDIFPTNRDQQELENNSNRLSPNLVQTTCRTIVMVVGTGFKFQNDRNLIKSYNLLCHFLDEECYRVVESEITSAFEVIRWEHPALVLLDGRGWDIKHNDLMERLHGDRLTREAQILIWNSHLPSILAVEALLASQPTRDSKTEGDTQHSRKSETLTKTRKERRLYHLLHDLKLKEFVDEVVDSWEALELVSILAEDSEFVFNLESLWYMLGLSETQTEDLVKRLAQCGFIEPIEIGVDDPLWSAVAFPEKLDVLKHFHQALKVKEYRLALATLILARDRNLK